MKTLYEAGTGCSIALLTGTDEVSQLVAVLEGIAAEEGWTPGTAIADYSGRAHHLAAIRDGTVVGGLQVALGRRGARFSFGDIWPEALPPDTCPIAHVSVLAVSGSARGGSPFFALCAELWRLCHQEGVGEIWHEVTPHTLRLYLRLGWPLEVVGEERPHWGEPCYLARMGMSEVALSLREKARSSRSTAALVEQASRPDGTRALLTVA